ncbi:MAG: transporter substrate-binding domain-containing protein, partial [Nitrospirae bacterium]|nr:transporter substrate-binding domain-containing protein [Nitrospirota bacterium]
MKSCLYIIALFLLIIIIDVSIPNVTLSENNIELTPEEKAFVTGKKVRLGVDSARPPFEFIDEKGRYCGISAAFIELCSKSLGLHIVLVPGLNVGAAMKKLGEGEIDIIPKISPEPERAKDILFTKPYATFASVIVTRQDVRFISGIDNLEGLKVGVLKGLIVERRMKRDYPGLLLVSLPDVRTALVELSSGKIDAYIDNMGIVSYNIDKLALTNLKIAAQTPYVYDMSFGVRKDWPLMASALDKALAGISKQEKSSITSKWLTVEYQSSINWKVIGPAAAALIIVIAIILIWNRRLQRAVKQREAVQMELKEYALELQKQSAVKSKISQISTALQKTVTFEEFAEQLLSLAVPLLNSVYGIFYLYDNNMQLLKSVGSYGCIIKDNSFAIGQGLVGQCAAELAPININNLSDSNIRINFGSGQVLPRAISFQPILQKNELLGVIEIASLSNYGSDYQNIFNELMPIIAMNIEILKRNLHTKTLLIETQQLAD